MQALQKPASIKFDYVAAYAAGGRPLIRVEFAAVNEIGLLRGTFQAVMLVDSGADLSMLPTEAMGWLGLDIDAMDEVMTLDPHGVEVAAPATWILARLCGQWAPVEVGFHDNSPPILGRAGAFDALVLGFDHSQGLLLGAARLV